MAASLSARWTRALWSPLAAGTLMAASVSACSLPDSVPEGSLSWAGRTWTVKSGEGQGPGPNSWSRENVWVDGRGFLHLRVQPSAGGWTCAELWTRESLGFGTYEWQVEGPVDRLDRNVVLGLFPYGPPDLGPDGTNEIDIEFARWGEAQAPAGNWTVYPDAGTIVGQRKFALDLGGVTATTNRFVWSASSVAYSLWKGFRDRPEDEVPLVSWTYAPPGADVLVPQRPMPLHMNLWLFRGRAPADGKPVEIVIRSFRKVP